ncbi:MAG: glutathione S-transferase family protein [Hoeflea sp.]|uniref:glutathione S-transferase family protein n=1 Tax=Hoeflea sp. TaxID=1940281 RepID=UPI003EF47CE5
MMTPILHTFSGAPRGWRVLLGLAFKGLKAEIRYMSVSDKDHHTPEFLALNRRATAPVLQTDDGILRDSIAILGWMDRAFPERPLFGANPQQAGEIWQITMECCDYLREANRQLLTQVFTSDGTVPPESSSDRDRFQSAADLLHAECRYLESILSDGRAYLSGNSPGAADAVAFPEIRLVQRAVETKHDLMAALGFSNPAETYPEVANWKARLNANPDVAATMPPHWGKSALHRETSASNLETAQ